MGRLCSIALAFACLFLGPELKSLADDQEGRVLSFDFAPSLGQRWKLSYKEESTRRLTIDGRPRPTRSTKLAFDAGVEASKKSGGSSLVEISNFSGSFLDVSWKDKKAKLSLIHKEDSLQAKWSETDWAAENKRSLAWLKGVFKEGLPQAMGPIFLPKDKVKQGSTWTISAADWLKVKKGAKDEIKNFQGQGKIVKMSPGGEAEFLIRVSYETLRFGKQLFEKPASYSLTLSGTISLEAPNKAFKVTTEALLKGTVMVDSLPGRQSKAVIDYRQKRVLSRS